MKKELLVKDLKKLISFKTVTEDVEENKKALKWVKNELKDLSLNVDELTLNGRPSLVVKTKEGKDPSLWLAAHMDVVPADEKLFKPKVKNGKLYGRGAYDMKFAISLYINLLKDLKGYLSALDLAVVITTDEEKGGFDGMNQILKQGYKGDLCILPDGGDDWKINSAAKGVYHLKVRGEGKAGHGSRPWKGENAIEKLVDFLSDLKKEYRKKYQKNKKKNKKNWYNTMNIGTISGGDAANQIPDRAEAAVDIRFIPRIKKSEINQLITKVKKDHDSIKTEEIVSGKSFKLDKRNKYAKKLIKLAKEKYNCNIDWEKSHGASDGRFLADNNIPTLLFKPKGGGTHADNEWVDIKDLKIYYNLLRDFVLKIGEKKS